MTDAGTPERTAPTDQEHAADSSSAVAGDGGIGVGELLEEFERRYAFGPVFFLTHLRAFVRDHCPSPADGLPAVELALADGARLQLCHVIGVAPAWVALAVIDEDGAGGRPMRTEFVPYASIARIGIRPPRGGDPGIGFSQSGPPTILGAGPAADAVAEQVLRSAAGAPVLDSPPGPAPPCHGTRSRARHAGES